MRGADDQPELPGVTEAIRSGGGAADIVVTRD